MSRPATWTPQMEADLKRYRAEGLSYTAIARRMGLTRGAVSGKIWRGEQPASEKERRDPEAAWDHKLFELWAERKARLAGERRANA